jgi:protease I
VRKSELRAGILTWSGFQDQEVVYPYYRLLAAGFKVDLVADQRDARNRVFGILGVHMPCNLLYKDFFENAHETIAKWDLLILPGGVKALEKLRLELNVIAFISRWNDEGKPIASTCHGAQLLISAGVARGRRLSGYYSIRDDINNAGGTYVDEPFVRDGNIVSSPHYDHMGPWMEEAISMVRA